MGSGSKGNSIFIRCGETRILIDAGLSARQIGKRLVVTGTSPDELDAVLLTHEHRDHVSGIKVLCKGRTLPVYCNPVTWRAASPLLGDNVQCEVFENATPFTIGNLTLEAFSVPHDASDTVGYVIHNGQHKIAVATDLGYVTKLVMDKLRDAQLLVLESNHDPDMLKEGPYPWVVKQRVWGRQGHLSNQESAFLLGESYHPGLRHVVLAHISEVNNEERLVRQMAGRTLAECALHEVPYTIARQDEAGPLIGLA